MTITENQLENYTLWQEWKEGSSLEARERLIEEYLPLVKYHAGRIKMVVPEYVDQDDLESCGVIGLLDAVQKFDHRRGISFATYASQRIRGEIKDYLRRLDWLPPALRRAGKAMKSAAERLASRLGRNPTAAELAEDLNISREQVEEVYAQVSAANQLSLYSQIGDAVLLDCLEDSNTPEPGQEYLMKEREDILARAIDRLKEQERLVISLYYYEGLTQKEITEVTGLSSARISQIHRKAIFRLRGMLGSRKGDLF